MLPKTEKKNRLSSINVYVREWAAPSVLLILLICGGVALFRFRLSADRAEFSDRTMHHAEVTIERVRPLRTTAQRGFQQGKVFVFEIQGQKLEYTAPFDANPGESIKVDYTVGATSGAVYVWGVERGDSK